MKKDSKRAKFKERSGFFYPRPQRNQENMKNVVLIEEVATMDREEDEEEVELMASDATHPHSH